MTITDRFELEFSRVVEGMCPYGHGRLAEDGRCDGCNLWWTASTCSDPRDIALYGDRKCGWSVKPPMTQTGGDPL